MKSILTVRRPRGQAVLEFAIILPLLVLILLGIIGFGELFSYRLRIDNAAREGCRKGVVGGTVAEIEAVVRNRANVPGANNGDCSTTPCLDIAVMPDDSGVARAVGDDMIVTVRYSAVITVPVVGLFTNPKTMYSRIVMRIERVP